MKKYERGEIAEVILSTLLIVGVVAVAVAMPNAVQLFKYFKPRNTSERAKIKRSVTCLEKGGFIKKKNENDGIFVLTPKGEMRALRYKIDTMRIPRQKKWDGRWRIVMFDIPEKKLQARRAINFALKKLGCAQYQKSVFITPFPCKEEIDFIGECFDVRSHIRIILAHSIEGDRGLKKTFGL